MIQQARELSQKVIDEKNENDFLKEAIAKIENQGITKRRARSSSNDPDPLSQDKQAISHLKKNQATIELTSLDDDEKNDATAISELKMIQETIEENKQGLKENSQKRTTLPGEIKRLKKNIRTATYLVECAKEEHDVARRSLFVDNLTDSLDSYLARRSLAYGIKDSFSPKDLKDRTSFIEDLKKALGKYEESGDVEQMGFVRKLIKDSLVRFPGVHLSSILNQMTVDLYEKEESLRRSSIADDTVQARTDQPVLSDTERLAVTNLRASIQKMKDYGAQIGGQFEKDCCSLADALHTDMGDFIRTDRTQKTYDQFSDKFKARLNSKNDLMAKHLEPWKVIVTNVLLALTGVGVLVIAGKLIHSKATTGRATFFGEETPGQHKVSDIKKALSGIKPSDSSPDPESDSIPTKP